MEVGDRVQVPITWASETKMEMGLLYRIDGNTAVVTLDNGITYITGLDKLEPCAQRTNPGA